MVYNLISLRRHSTHYSHGADIWVEGGEDDLPVAAMLEDSLEDLVYEQVHLHLVLLLLLTVLQGHGCSLG